MNEREYKVRFFITLKEVDNFIESLGLEWKFLKVITRPYNEMSHYVVVIYKERA